MASQKYRGSCIGAALAKWLAKNTVTSQKMALEEKMEDGALEMLLYSYIAKKIKVLFHTRVLKESFTEYIYDCYNFNFTIINL